MAPFIDIDLVLLGERLSLHWPILVFGVLIPSLGAGILFRQRKVLSLLFLLSTTVLLGIMAQLVISIFRYHDAVARGVRNQYPFLERVIAFDADPTAFGQMLLLTTPPFVLGIGVDLFLRKRSTHARIN